jgi:2-alkyl-3-oxoalkanoate reductase
MSEETKLRVLVTGGSGFLGSHVCEQLSRAGHEVVALVRRSSNQTFLSGLPNVQLAYGSVEDSRALADAVDGVDAIIHAAGLVKAMTPDDFDRVNVGGTQNLLEAAQRRTPAIQRFVFVSSLAAVGPSIDGRPIPANREPRPVTAYGRSKLQAERKVLEHRDSLPITVIRPPLIYGPRDRECFTFFQMVSRRVLPFVDGGNNTMSVVYGADAASACIRAVFADVPSGSAYFLSDGQVYVWREMLAELECILQTRALLRFSIPKAILKGAALASEAYGRLASKPVMLTRDKVNELLQDHWVCDSSGAVRELGWKPEFRWPEGARRTAEWYRAQGWL